MSTAQNFDHASANTADELTKDQPPLNDATGGAAGGGGGSGTPGGILGVASDAVGNISHVASNAVKQGADAVVSAGKGVLEMGGSVISGLKRGFSKTSESGND